MLPLVLYLLIVSVSDRKKIFVNTCVLFFYSDMYFLFDLEILKCTYFMAISVFFSPYYHMPLGGPCYSHFSSVQLLSCVQLFEIPWTAVHQASLSITNSQSLTNSYPSTWWCHPTISSSVGPSPPSFNLSQHQSLFKWVSSLQQVAKIFEFQHQSFQWIFRMDWMDLLAVQWTLKSLLQQHSSKASVLQHSALFIVQLSHLYMTTGKTIALTR